LEFVIHNDQIHLERIPIDEALIDSINPNLVSFTSPVDGTLSEVRLSLDPTRGPSEKNLSFEITSQPDSEEVLAKGTLTNSFIGGVEGPGFRVPLDNPLELEEGQEYYLKVGMDDSNGSLVLRGAAIANEGAWDDGLPVRLDGYDGFAGIYEPGLNFDMYEDDNPNKLSRFYNILDHAEYILFSSSRQWGTLPRIPERFPMSSEYYRYLLGCPPDRSIEWCYNAAQVGDFQGALGFELIEVFQSDSSIGSISLNDQPSEEAFTVYDHPKVFIFRKSVDYDPEEVRQLLGAVDLSRVEHITPKKAGELPKDMMLPINRLAAQLQGGTWSQLFDIDSWINRWPAVTVVVWYFAVALLGFIAYPIIRFAFSGLSDRGYPLARTAGLLFLSYFVWLAGSFKIPFNSLTISVAVIVLAILSAVLVYFQRESLKREWRERRTYFLVIEGLFLAFFVIDLLIRFGNPDLWHPWKGGERPMDFSYLNAVLKSTTFPPYDPWFAGGYINYYYYGFVYLGVLVKWLGVVPSVAYNLIIPTIFSMIVMGAFSIGWNLVSAGRSAFQHFKNLIKSIPFITGIAAALAVGVLGNLGTLRMIYQGYQKLAAPGGNIEGANIIFRIFWTVKGALLSLTGSSLPYGIPDWYWFPSRAIPAPNDVEPITEFPFFTVLYGDPHAHLFALPITLLALSWALSILFARGWGSKQQDSRRKSILRVIVSVVIGGLAIGALRPTNTWDFPVYLVFGLLAVGYVFWKYAEPSISSSQLLNGLPTIIKRLFITLGALILLGISAVLLFQPYANWYVQGYTEIAFWRGSHTPFWSYMTHWGLFLFIIIAWMVWETREWMASTPLAEIRKLTPYRGLILVGLVLSIVWIAALQIIGISIAWLVILLMIWVGVLLFRPGNSDAKRAVLVMIGSGLALTLMVEIIVLVGDIGRMNTVFKFYLQVWTLFGLSAAVVFGWTLKSISQWTPRWQFAWKVSVVVLVASAALYPLLGTTARVKDRMTDGVPWTLDGMAYMEYAEYDDLGTRMDLSQDYEAIRWLQENVTGSPTIIEGNMVEYHWGTRNTIYTGLPNVIGWNWHQRQQRATAPEDLIEGRISEVNEFYLTTDPARAKQILDTYDVQYIVVGQLEQALYPGQGLNKFSSHEGVLWQEVFRVDDTVIYHVLN
jgi:YYY domain-containing protein